MCEFCINKKKIVSYGKIGKFWINFHDELNCYTLVSSNNEENDMRGFDIKFCPMCGRKLSEMED